MSNGKIQPFTSLDQSKHHCYTLSTTCTLFKLASEVGPRTKGGVGGVCRGRGGGTETKTVYQTVSSEVT